jgi:hypothetical protein
MPVRVIQSATCNGRAVALLELELEPERRIWIFVLDLPPAPGTARAQHWSRTELELDRALELYDQAMRDHIAPAAE